MQTTDTPTPSNKPREKGKGMDERLISAFLAGATGGSVSAIILQPLDLVKTRLQSSIYVGSNTGVMKVVISVVQKERIAGLWTGAWPSVTRCGPGIGLYFGILHWLKKDLGSANPSALESLLLGMSARSISCSLILPITVIKTRYESGAFRYRGIAHALTVIYKAEGLRGLYSGLLPTLLRDVPYSGLYYMFYTRLKLINQRSITRESFQVMMDFCNGAMAGFLASFVTQPADVIKTSMQMYPAKHQSIMQSCCLFIRNEDLQGFGEAFFFAHFAVRL
ncbi:mitochondrial glycine transporter-like isoform X2 [Pomacea canaliculata]|uniref:mitochondrial glycine transporter-like isoform X2 n=1 Tax=Pomacea canaliculata TaxID=400727 RepID=UPI000D7318B8|nr:mitochondrial glycine transporter-like isoform X2 [Pomacea canaliculata]